MAESAQFVHSGTDTHFLLELLQNVDDCTFGSEMPQLRIIIEDDSTEFHKITSLSESCRALLALEYNETGFEERNVRALCDIAQSTKTARHYIGAKGIGFKSVFRVTRTPVIHSGEFHFHFDSSALDGLGYLVPFPLPPLPPSGLRSDTGGTRLVLPLYESCRLAEVRSHVEDLEPTLLLFLRNLRVIEVSDLSAGLRKRMSKGVIPNGDDKNSVVVLETSTQSDTKLDVKQQWALHSFDVIARGEDGEIVHTDLILAFRLDSSAPSRPNLQKAFAWLPLRSYGFRFILQADWVIPSSRESIVESNVFNQAIRDAIPASFAAAAKAILKAALVGHSIADSTETLLLKASTLEPVDMALKHQLVEFYNVIPLPGDAADFFAPIPAAILEEGLTKSISSNFNHLQIYQCCFLPSAEEFNKYKQPPILWLHEYDKTGAWETHVSDCCGGPGTTTHVGRQILPHEKRQHEFWETSVLNA